MRFDAILTLFSKPAELYAQKLWSYAQKKGAHFYQHFLCANPAIAAAHIAHFKAGLDLIAQKHRGFVYICTHPSQPGLIKIGSTTKQVEARMRSLRTAGIPGRHTAIGSVSSFNARALEAQLHQQLRPMRHEREWFRTSPEMALALLTRTHAAALALRRAMTPDI